MSDYVADLLSQLQKNFGVRIYKEAARLVDEGSVFDVRVLQAGAVVTGFANTPTDNGTARHRVYIQYRSGRQGDPTQQGKMEGECSCGEPDPCIHVAAVSIAAAKGAHKLPVDARRAGVERSPQWPASTQSVPGQQQRLYYLLDSPFAAAADTKTAGELRLSVWVGRTRVVGEPIDAEGALAFAPRSTSEFPRYVDAQDRAILQALTTRHIEGPWELHGESGANLLEQAVATGRAHWRSLRGEALRPGRARHVDFTWKVLPDGHQRLCCEASASVEAILDVEPAIYVDAATNECGPLDLPCPAGLLRQYCKQPAVAPEQVATVNEQIARIADGTALPTLHALSVCRQALSSLGGKLVLSSGPQACLHFVYNGLAIDSRSLRADPATVRRMNGRGTVLEIDRACDTEQRLRAQLDRVLPDSRQGRQAWLAFMMNAVPALQADGWDVVTQIDFPYRLADSDNWYADVQTDPQQPWFDLRLGVVVDGHRANLLPALVSYLQEEPAANDTSSCRVAQHLLVRLDDGRYLPVAIERIQRIADTLVELLDRDSLNKQQALSLPVAQVSRLAQLARDLDKPPLRSDEHSMLALIDDLQDFSGIEPLPAPAHFQATLRPYQQEGLGWLQFLRRYRLGGILADDMGLGKTVQALAHLALEKNEGRLQKPALIVAPVSVIGNWQQEIRRLAPTLELLTLHGSRRKEFFPAIDRADVLITGYPLLQLDSDLWLAREFSVIILDEAQMIKNPRAKVSQVARELRAEHRLCLTGTPMENHLGELWSLFDFLQPGLLGDEKQFQRHYRTPIEKSADSRRSEALSRRIAPFILRRTKDAVAPELPPKTQIVESIVLDERQRDFYDGIRLAMHRRVREAVARQGLARSQITMLDALLKLRQACCDPRLVKADAQTASIPSAKMEWLLTVLPELVAEGRRVLLFSQFTSMLRLIEAAIAQLSIPYCLLTGETQDRAALVRRFQAGAVPLFLISLKAGGTGLNLTAADTVIHYDPWWNPAAEAQATDRAHRIGQDQPVFVYKLITQGTVEEKIMQLQADKQALASRLYTQENASPARLSAAELQALFEQ